MKKSPSKYRVVAGWAEEQIRQGILAEGRRLPSEHELCAQFGVSRQTVRRAIATLENAKLVESRQGSGTYVLPLPATSPPEEDAPGQKTIGVVSSYTDDYIFPSIIRGIEQTLAQNGCAMRLAATRNRVENETTALQNLMEQPVDGIIAEPTQSGLPNPNMDLYKQIVSRGIPVLFFNSYYPELSIPHVALDDKQAGKLATQHLIDAGHRKIAGIFQSDDIQGHLRYAGYMDTMIQHARFCSQNVFWFDTGDIPGLFRGTHHIMERLEGCTAAFCYNDIIASKLIHFLAGRGIRVPCDLSLVSMDDSALAIRQEPKLTSIHHPKENLGKEAAAHMLHLLKHPAFSAGKLFPAEIIKRNSVLPGPIAQTAL